MVVTPSRAANPLGAVYAAALGAAEAFKWTAQVLPARRVVHRYLRFCPVTLSSDLTAAPDLASPLVRDLTQIGVGAIGTGTILALQALRAEGRLIAVDCQRFGPENRGTYSLGGAAEVCRSTMESRHGTPGAAPLRRHPLPPSRIRTARRH